MLKYDVNTTMGKACVNDYTVGALNIGNNAMVVQAEPWAFPTSDTTTTSGPWEAYEAYERRMKDWRKEPTVKIEPTKPKKEEVKKMGIPKSKRGLFQVILVDPKGRKILFNDIVISDTVEDVLLEVDAGSIIKKAGLKISEVDKIINVLGVIRKSKRNKEGVEELIEDEEKKS